MADHRATGLTCPSVCVLVLSDNGGAAVLSEVARLWPRGQRPAWDSGPGHLAGPFGFSYTQDCGYPPRPALWEGCLEEVIPEP